MARLKTIRPWITPTGTRTVQPPAKTGDPLYHSSRWRTLLEGILADRRALRGVRPSGLTKALEGGSAAQWLHPARLSQILRGRQACVALP